MTRVDTDDTDDLAGDECIEMMADGAVGMVVLWFEQNRRRVLENNL